MAKASESSRRKTAGRAVPAGSLLTIEGIDAKELERILDSARAIRRARPASLARKLAGKRIALLFYEPSTRTRVSFEFAAHQLGATTSVITVASSSIEKGESLLDTGYTLQAAGADAIVMRHPNSGAAQLLARHLDIPLINAGDGMHEHPTQALLDALTILDHKKRLRGLRVVITGDVLHSRVARSNAHLLHKFGAHVVFCGPKELLPELAQTLTPTVTLERDLDSALHAADVVMMLRVQKERLAGLDLDLADYVRRYQLTAARLRAAKKDALVMHPGPMVRGLEVTTEVADGPQSVIRQQVENGRFVRQAVLARALK